jgi:hypothetical protein
MLLYESSRSDVRCIQTSSLINSCFVCVCVCAYSTPCNVNTSRENRIEHLSPTQASSLFIAATSLCLDSRYVLTSTCAVFGLPELRITDLQPHTQPLLERNGGKILEMGMLWG